MNIVISDGSLLGATEVSVDGHVFRRDDGIKRSLAIDPVIKV